MSSAAGRTWQVVHTRTNSGAIRDSQPAVDVVEERTAAAGHAVFDQFLAAVGQQAFWEEVTR